MNIKNFSKKQKYLRVKKYHKKRKTEIETNSNIFMIVLVTRKKNANVSINSTSSKIVLVGKKFSYTNTYMLASTFWIIPISNSHHFSNYYVQNKMLKSSGWSFNKNIITNLTDPWIRSITSLLLVICLNLTFLELATVD